MLKLVPNRPDWSENDRAGCREFFLGVLGQKLLITLMADRPEVTAVEREKRVIQSDERAGFEGCLADILALCAPVQNLSQEDRNSQSSR